MNSLPDFIILKIVEFCDLKTRFKLERVSKRFKRLTGSVWKSENSVNLRLLYVWTSDDKKKENSDFQQILISLLNRCGPKLNSLHVNTETNFVSLRIIHMYFPKLKILSLEKVSLSTKCYGYLKEFKQLEEIRLCPQNELENKIFGVPENHEIVQYLKDAMKNWKFLKKFGFVTNSMTVISTMVHLSSTVVDLFVGCMCITGAGCDALKTFLYSHPNLKRFSLWTKNCHEFIQCLSTHCNQLESLSVYTKFFKPLDLSSFPKLTEISLPSLWQSNNNVRILHQTLASCNELKILRLTLGRFCTSEPLPNLSNLKTVNVVDLSRTKTSTQFLQSLLSQCSELTEIILDLNEEDFQTDVLLKHCPKLKTITLKNDGFIIPTKNAPSVKDTDSKSLKFILNMDRKLCDLSIDIERKLAPLKIVVEWSEKQKLNYLTNLRFLKFIKVVNSSESW